MPPVPAQDISSLATFIPWIEREEWSDSYQFTPIHKNVCGVDDCDLAKVLQDFRADIDNQDIHGCTALTYAVRFGRCYHARHLLEKGADPNAGRKLPLVEALRCHDSLARTTIEMMELLNAGASIDVAGETFVDKWATTYLWNGKYGITLDKLILDYGLDVTRPQKSGQTLLNKCFWYWECSTRPSMARIEQLIDQGASSQWIDADGRSAVLFALMSRSTQPPRLLATYGLNLKLEASRHGFFLHFAVMCIEESRIIDEMRKANLSDVIDLGFIDVDGYTAFELLKKRNSLNWHSYKYSKHFFSVFRSPPSGLCARTEKYIISDLEAFLHEIQEAQGVAKDQQYPSLGDYLSSVVDSEPIPGAWPL